MHPSSNPIHHRSTDRSKFDSNQLKNIDLSSILEVTDRKTKQTMMTNHGSDHSLKIPKNQGKCPEKVGYHEPFAPMFYPRPKMGPSSHHLQQKPQWHSKMINYDQNNS
jgi:hypothetical protein